MPETIYRSSYPSFSLVNRSVFTHLLGTDNSGNVGHYPAIWPAYTDSVSGVTLTRGQIRDLALSFAFGLENHPRIHSKRGDVALVYSPNSLSWPVFIFGSIAAGLRTTLANTAYSSHELAFQYTDSGARLVYTTEEGLPTVRGMFEELGIGSEGDERIIILGNSLRWAGGPSAPSSPSSAGLIRLEDLLTLGSLAEEEKFDGQLAHETVILCYSSGTTGKPKGVETTHQNLTSVAEAVRGGVPSDEKGVLLGILPSYHIYGAVKQLFFSLRAGMNTVFQSRFEPEAYCANIEKYKVTLSLIVPPVLVVLARHPAVERYDLSSLKLIISGAAPLGAALTQQVTARLRSVNVDAPIIQGYGLTETSPTTHITPIDKSESAVGSIGVILANLEARLVAEDGVDVKEGEAGEIWLRGPTVMKGYLNNPVATKESITPDGWFQTGDVAYRNKEGLFYIVDRRKELIKYKGFQVPPAELESVLLSHPDIADAAVIGIYANAQATELPRAYVVPANPDSVKTEAQRAVFTKGVARWIESKVARHKFLRGGVVVIDIVPKSAAGKILRRDLRERAKAELDGPPTKAKL